MHIFLIYWSKFWYLLVPDFEIFGALLILNLDLLNSLHSADYEICLSDRDHKHRFGEFYFDLIPMPKIIRSLK